MIIVYVRTTDACTRCRLCGERPPAESPVVRVHSPHTSRISQRYYCMYCWDYLVEHAGVDIPELLQSTGAQAAQRLGVLLGIRPGVQAQDHSIAERVELDMTIKFPARLLVSRAPFERWYPRGAHLVEHQRRARESMGHDAS